MSENKTEANEAWDSIEVGHGDVAIDLEYDVQHDLPSTITHPKHPSMLLYIIESYHAIHCLVCDSSFVFGSTEWLNERALIYSNVLIDSEDTPLSLLQPQGRRPSYLAART